MENVIEEVRKVLRKGIICSCCEQLEAGYIYSGSAFCLFCLNEAIPCDQTLN